MNKSAAAYSDLKARTLSAIVMLIVAGLSIWYGGLFFQIVLLVTAFLVMWEIVGLSHGTGALRILIAVLYAIALALAFWVGGIYTLIGFCLWFVLYIVTQKSKDILLCCGLAILAFGGLLTLYNLRNDVGMIQTIWVIVCVIASDIGGYFAGRSLGGPKLWPAVSPKKTWSGTIGGWVLAVIATYGFILWAQDFNTGHLIWAVIIAVFAQSGDLAESALKRRAGVKDSSNLIPGHGGFLDRLDGMFGAFFLIFLLNILNLQSWLF